MPAWLKDAVFYEIYPQSFYDSNGDGIGDIPGIISKLDYICSLGANALWINPCFDSPFKDAGYDVRDYKKVAPRYGTNDDLVRLFKTAHEKGIKVLLDLVPGHTSEEHEWFKKSCEEERNEYSDRYIWSDFCFAPAGIGNPYIGGESKRNGTYLLNFFKCQPALNYGWLKPQFPWQCTIDAPAAIATREAMKDVMRFWMDQGCDGFRVDMAASLVKNDDEKKTGTSKIWKNVREMFDKDYPECVLVSEWSNPELSLAAGFHCDFMLNEGGPQKPMYSTLVRDYQNHADHIVLSDGCFNGKVPVSQRPYYEDHSYFHMDSDSNIMDFITPFTERYEKTKDLGYISPLTCNHDTVRPAFGLSEQELKLYYALLFTLPGVPFLYYGDEVGMHYQSLHTKEGGYFRTGSRTPMQWTEGKNLGFSDADADALYLPVDPDGAEQTVQAQEGKKDSLLEAVRGMLAARHQYDGFKADAPFKVLHAAPKDPLLIYSRGDRIVAINPSSKTVEAKLDSTESRKAIWSVGQGTLENGVVTLAPQTAVFF